jgi:hypothetical protein
MATHNPDINLGRNAQALVSCEVSAKDETFLSLPGSELT